MSTYQQCIRQFEKQVTHLTEVNEILKKGARVLHQPSKSIKYTFMQQQITQYRMKALCEALSVNRLTDPRILALT